MKDDGRDGQRQEEGEGRGAVWSVCCPKIHPHDQRGGGGEITYISLVKNRTSLWPEPA